MRKPDRFLRPSAGSRPPSPSWHHAGPWLANGLLLAGLLGIACASASAAIVINEVCYDNSSVADDTGDTSSDWIELYNSGPGSVNLTGYALGDANPYEEAKGVRLPNYTLPAGGRLLVFANPDLPEYTVWTNAPNIALIPANATWKYLAPSSAPPASWLTASFNDTTWASGMAPLGYNDATVNLDCATVLSYGANPAQRPPAAYFRKAFTVINPSVITSLVLNARINDGVVAYLNGTVILRQNMPEGAIGFTTPALMGVPTTLWTTNVLPTTGLLQGTNVLAVEVHQASVSSPDLIMDMTLTALVNEQVPIVHGQFGLSKDGENIHLFNSTLTRIHRLDSPGFEIGEDRSYGLATDGVTTAFKVFQQPTPGLPNTYYEQKYQETLTTQKPLFSIPPGIYASSQNVVLTTPTPGYRIFYTLDGSDPRHSTVFVYSGNPVSVAAAASVTSGLAWTPTAPIELAQTVPEAAWQPPEGSVTKAVVLRAIAVSSDGKYCSPERSGTYLIGPSFASRPLPIVSIVTDANNLFGFTQGIYVPGKYYADSPEGYGANKWGKPYANYHQTTEDADWERPVQFELFETGQTTAAFSQRLGVTLHGGGTRALPQKALYLLARLAEYGADRVNYPLFPDQDATSYKRFLLRSSGNDWYGPDDAGVATMLKDAVFHRMVQGLDIAVMAYRPTVLYINGEYWGIHNLRESFDKHYLATRYGLEADNCDILVHEEDPTEDGNVHIERIDGDSNADEEYEAMIDWIDANPLSLAANYQQVQQWIDVSNYTDYIIAETFFGNTDWPINNCDFWRAHTNQVAVAGKYGDSRWRWMLYDLDVAGERGAAFDMFEFLSDNDMTGPSEPAFLINALWANMDFRNAFVTRYVNLLNTTFRPDRLADIIAQAAAVIAPEIETHFRRWGRTHTQARWLEAVDRALVQYTAARHNTSWAHLDTFFGLGGTGSLTLRNTDANGTGGRFQVNGVLLDTSTEGVTNRAAWTGTFFRSLPVPVQAAADAGYVFDGWDGTAITNPSPTLFVGETPVTLAGRFRLATAPAYVPTGYEQWQVANYSESAILGGTSADPNAPSGYADMNNLELYAFGMHRTDGLTDAQRRDRASLSIQLRPDGLWLAFNRLNDTFTDIQYAIQTTAVVDDPTAWREAVVGQDLDPVSNTTAIDASTWHYEVRLTAEASAQGVRYFRIIATLD
ncbi:MAG TPA: CotH kinase family protein [Verrucomicrobiota bacterium]|nr:CotH kinase family protein [Verrucomicrobiota bacterium]HNU52222.1 CotH kinase family protein [Verrucomicrobiota bacterium]